MIFVGLSIPFQVEGSNHPHSEQMWLILYSRPSGRVIGKQAGMAQDALIDAVEIMECYVPQEWEKDKKQCRPPSIPDLLLGRLEDMGIFVGEVYDERIIEESN
jgi:hypothetical protein